TADDALCRSRVRSSRPARSCFGAATSMAKQELDGAKIGAGLEWMNGEGMPQRMRRHGLGKAGYRQTRTQTHPGLSQGRGDGGWFGPPVEEGTPQGSALAP